MRKTVAAALGLSLVTSLARADDLPVALSHSGRLLDAAGEPLDKPDTSFTFRLFERSGAAIGEETLWEGSCTAPVSLGLYGVVLGATCGTGLTTAQLPPGADRYLEVEVDGVTLTPRLALTSSPSATVAGVALDAEALGGVGPDGYWKKAESVEAASLDAALQASLDDRYARLQDVDGSVQSGHLKVSGDVTASGFHGSGAALTELPAANLVGTLPLETLPGTVALTGADVTFDGKVTAKAFAGDGSALTGLTATQIGGKLLDSQLANGPDFARRSTNNAFSGKATFGGANGTSIDGAVIETGSLKARGDLTVVGQVTHQGRIGRLCPNDHYLSMGYCLPKGELEEKTECAQGTLRRGVCYAWPSTQCQFQSLPQARSICKGMGARLCTVGELDRLDGAGCGGDYSRVWANLSTAFNDDAVYGLCLRASTGISRAGGKPRFSAANVDDIAGCDAVHGGSPSATSTVDGMVLCCFD